MVNYNEVFKLSVQKGYERKYSDSVLENTRAKSTEDELVYIECCLIERWLRKTHSLCISIGTTLVENYISAYILYSVDRINSPKEDDFISFLRQEESYEQALLEGINEALKLLPDAV